MIFQSTLPAWGATAAYFDFVRSLKISIHAPRMGSDRMNRSLSLIAISFQSTLPAWGATDEGS